MASEVPHLDNTVGAAYVGVVVAAILHGITLVQGWYYFTHQKDRWGLRLLVSAVLFFDTIHQILISHAVYFYVITNFNNPPMLGNLVWSLLVEVIFNGLTALLVQSFLTMRIWRLSDRNIALTASVLLLVLGEFACVVVFTGHSLRLKTFAEAPKIKNLSIAVNVLGAAGDVLIAASLCFLLHRSRTGFQSSETIINRLILFSVNTGFLTTLCAIASLISILVAEDTFLYIAFYFCLGRLYSNSLLATLNARRSIQKAAFGLNTTRNRTHSVQGLPTTAISSPITISSERRANLSVQIDTTFELQSDFVGDNHDDHTESSKPPSFLSKEEII